MFSGNAEEATTCSVDPFENSKILRVTHYGASEMGREWTVRRAEFALMLKWSETDGIGRPVQQDFTFTPAISLYGATADEKSLDCYFEVFSGRRAGPDAARQAPIQ